MSALRCTVAPLDFSVYPTCPRFPEATNSTANSLAAGLLSLDGLVS